MSDWLVLVHTLAPLIDVFNGLVPLILPGVEVKHVLDEPLLECVRRRGALAEEDGQRLRTHLDIAEIIGAKAVLVTCSTISPLVDVLRPQFSLPLVKIDEAMITRAVQDGQHIHVLATNPTTLAPTRLMLTQQAERKGREIKVTETLVKSALDLLLAGDGEAHDRLVREAIVGTDKQVDLILLAQASMARALRSFPERERPFPVYSSPPLALESLKPIFQPHVL